MRKFILIMFLFCNSSLSAEHLDPPDVDLESYISNFHELLNQGKFSLYDKKLSEDDLTLKSISFEYRLNCNKKIASYFAKLTNPIKAQGELKELNIVAIYVTISIAENGDYITLPVLGDEKSAESQSLAMDKQYNCKI